MRVPYDELARVARNGSPLLVTSVGRLFGLGQAEREALVNGGIPRWAVLVVGVGAGFVAGAWLRAAYPKQISKVVGR